MQISTNWSVSHLRHWRPPVASSGYYLYRYTGRSWFKSKQSALRSILPNANIHHNEKRPGRGQGQTPGAHFGVCFSLWRGGEAQNQPPPVGLHETANTKEDWEDVVQCERVDDGWVSPSEKQSQTLIVTIEKSRWYVWRRRTDKGWLPC